VSLDHYETARRRVGSIQARLNETIDSIRSNPSLSASGRRAEMARATADANKMAARVKTEIVGARDQRRNELTSYLFGRGPGESDVLAVRDAADRAAKIEGPNDASAALKQAQLAGDKSMQKAITHLAADRGWTDVVTQYIDGLPLTEAGAVAVSMRTLAELPHGPNADRADDIVFRVRSPRELSAYREGEIERLAADAAPVQPAPVSAGPVGGSYF
jgi:hypothetical protein